MYKVLFLGWEYYPVFTGGLGIVCSAIAEEVAKKGFEVYVVVPNVPKEISISNIKFPHLKFKDSEVSFNTNSNINVKVSSIDLDPYFTKLSDKYSDYSIEDLKRILGSNMAASFGDKLYGNDLLEKVMLYTELIKNLVVDLEFDVIHAHDWMTFLAANEAKNISGKKCVMHVHATEFDRTANNPHTLIFNIEKYMLNQADTVVAISNYSKDSIIDKYGIDPNKIKVVHNALDERRVNAISERLNVGGGKTVLFLGRAVVQKGVDSFVLAAKKVLEKLPDTNFIFAGDGDLLPRVIELVAEHGLSKNFLFSGSVDRYQGDVLYSNADLFVMTSISEPFGITALEAVRQGTPVIVSKTSGVSEVIPNALKADFWDTDKFADFIVNALTDRVLYDSLAEAQIQDYKKLTWKSQVEKLIEIYHNLI